MARLTSLFAVALSVACAGRGPAIMEPYGEPPPVPDDEAAGEAIDLTAVVWPETSEPLPTDVPWWTNDFGHRTQQRHQPEFWDAPVAYARLSAPSRPGTLSPTVMYCRVSLARSGDDPRPAFRSATRAQADLSMMVRVGSSVEYVVVGANNDPTVYFGVPLTTLAVGDVVAIRVVDRDFIAHDAVGSLQGTYDGRLPLTMSSGPLSGECVAEDGATVQDRGRLALEAADYEIARVLAQPEPALDPVPRVDHAPYARARQAVAHAADWLTYSHPAVQLRRARLDALLTAHEQRVGAAFDALVADLRLRAEVHLPSGASVRVVEVTCAARAASMLTCRAVLAIPSGSVTALRGRAYTRESESRVAYGTSVASPTEAVDRLVELDLAPFDAYALRGAAPVILELSESASGPFVYLLLPPVTRSP
jgi:hypothetical protein